MQPVTLRGHGANGAVQVVGKQLQERLGQLVALNVAISADVELGEQSLVDLPPDGDGAES